MWTCCWFVSSSAADCSLLGIVLDVKHVEVATVALVLPLTPSIAGAGVMTEGEATEAMIEATTEEAMGVTGTTEVSTSAEAMLLLAACAGHLEHPRVAD